MKRKNLRVSLVCLLLSLAMLLAGCGGSGSASPEDLLADMKEFALEDGSASIYLNKDWEIMDMGMSNLMMAGTDDGSEGVFIFQFPKNGVYRVHDIDSLKDIIHQSFQISDESEAEAIEVPGLSNISVVRSKITAGGVKGEACLIYGESDYAFYTIGYMGSKWNDSKLAALKASCSKFAESEEAVSEMDSTSAELTDTIRWFNASYAVLTELNGWDYNRFAGLPANDTTRELEIASLEEWWGVTDRASADSTLAWILDEGHRTDFALLMADLDDIGLGEEEDRKGFLMNEVDFTEEEADMYLSWYEMYEQYGPDAIAGWDYCRALNLMSFYYLAGYYTEQEALDKSLEIALEVQPLFDSWDDLIASYMRGYEYWAEESSADRQAIYEDIKTRSDNPYAVDFKMDLVKTW